MGNSSKRFQLITKYKDIIERLPFLNEKGEKKHMNNFICPLCLKTYQFLDPDNNITIEHVPPEKLGGKPLLLTCKDCNSICGYNLDIYLINEVRNSYVLRHLDKKRHKAKLQIEDVCINADATIIGNSDIFFNIDEQKNNPKSYNALNKYLATDDSIYRINATIKLSEQKTNTKKAAIAILKSAYLLAFYYLGYRYILHSNLDPIRKQILYPDNDLFGGKYILSNERHLPAELTDGIYLISLNSISLYGVILSFKAQKQDYTHRSLVALPHPEDKDSSLFIKEITEIEKATPTISIKARLTAKEFGKTLDNNK